jgi:hypothetical protein
MHWLWMHFGLTLSRRWANGLLFSIDCWMIAQRGPSLAVVWLAWFRLRRDLAL